MNYQNKRQQIFSLIMKTHNDLTLKMRELLKPYGVTLQQYTVLKLLFKAEKPMSTNAIRDALTGKQADTSRMVNRLCQKGYASRCVCGKDKRLVDVLISKNGKKVIEEINEDNICVDNLLPKLTIQEERNLEHILNKIQRGLSE